MKIIINESQLSKIIKEDYSEKITIQLISKFKQEEPDVDENKLREYIMRFDKIKNDLNTNKRDLFQYTLPELETVLVNSYENQKIKSKPLNHGLENEDRVFWSPGLDIYKADSLEGCITYGNGYRFCISSRGNDNKYNHYRLNQRGTPYFVFNHMKTNKKNSQEDFEDGDDEYMDPEHLMVIFVIPYDTSDEDGRYPNEEFEDGEPSELFNGYCYWSVTNANNQGEEYYLSFGSIEYKYPFLNGLQDIFTHIRLSNKDINLKKITHELFKNIDVLSSKHGYISFVNSAIGEGTYEKFPSAVNTEQQKKMLSAYRNGIHKDFRLYRLNVYENKNPETGTYPYRSIKVYYGEEGLKDAKEEVSKLKSNAKMDLEDRTKYLTNYNDIPSNVRYRYANIPDDVLLLTNNDGYKLVVVPWNEQYMEYMKKINSVFTDFEHKKWKIRNNEL